MRLFVGVWPPEHVLAELAGLPRPAVPGIRWTVPEQWHVTLRFLGEQPPGSVDLLGAALGRAVGATRPAVEVRLGPATERLGPGVLCLPAVGLDELAAAVRHELDLIGLPARDPDARRPYRGHLTLARARRGARISASLTGVPFDAAWSVGEVDLVASTTAPEGARYETVRRATIH